MEIAEGVMIAARRMAGLSKDPPESTPNGNPPSEPPGKTRVVCGDLVVTVQPYVAGSWEAWVNGGPTVSSSSRDSALFWAGWWHGRRALGAIVAHHVERGQAAPAAPTSGPACPKCGGAVKPVTQGESSALNSEQFDAVRAGDWYCERCPQEAGTAGKARTGFAYFWDADVRAAQPAAEPAPDVFDRTGILDGQDLRPRCCQCGGRWWPPEGVDALRVPCLACCDGATPNGEPPSEPGWYWARWGGPVEVFDATEWVCVHWYPSDEEWPVRTADNAFSRTKIIEWGPRIDPPPPNPGEPAR
jgi:hypothetical protein